jgi:hypothetical protein
VISHRYQTVYVGQGIGPLGLQAITLPETEMIVNSLKPDGSLEWVM